jgi:hypothetical protein
MRPLGTLAPPWRKLCPVSCPLSGSAFLLNFNPVFSKSSLVGLDFEGVCARLVCCVVPVLLPIQAFAQAFALSGADSAC